MQKKISGALRKLSSQLENPVYYWLSLETESPIFLNTLLGQKISLRYLGKIFCIHCGRKTIKSFQQGYCFPCYRRLLECNLCLIHPERCRFHEGICRPDDWAHAHCVAPHVVYLANSSGLKVGITRLTQTPFRWIDQGATQALVIAKVNNRWQAGQVEVALKSYVADKTDWRVMLRGGSDPIDLFQARDELLTAASSELENLQRQFDIEIVDETSLESLLIHYPVLEYPRKVVPLNFDKTPEMTGKFMGIKGQYLMLDHGVLSIRKFGGYQVEFGY